ncbi:unnamed protein product [Cladocopium goreaui]|uniref:Cyclin-dependent kinase-like 4 n=1 Tax=Cladocopium goreaui TaxID=2562237 RepID=A0A9P1FPL1_9DINO|nr:unnamed protein product [Cladocopium goreaui]
MQVNGLYEASGLVLWLRTGVYSAGISRDISPGDVAFSALRKFEADYFSKDVALNAFITRGPKKQRQQKPRLIWPITMVCGVEASSDIENRMHFDSCLNTAGNHASECLKSIKDAALSATFIDFAHLVKLLNIQQVSDGTHHKLRFNNASYNASMHRAAMGILTLINDGPEFEASMRKLELAYGRDLLSNAYSKLNRLQQIAKGAATAAQASPSGTAQNSGKVAG